MWRQPQYSELDAPQEMKELIHQSIYYNSEGKLAGADLAEVVEVGLMYLVSWIGLSLLLSYLASLIFSNAIVWQAGASLISLGLTGGIFFLWGWQNYEEAWYHFDRKQEILTVISREKKAWEMVEIPYETVDRVAWSGGKRGKAIIHAGSFRFETNRAGSKRYSSVTELWDNLARLDSSMEGWPIRLYCPECDRQFGHHIGTAQCPFDEVILIDPEIKGRIDPKEQHPDDIDRI